MVNAIETIYSHELDKDFRLRFCVNSWIQQETPEEDWKTHQLKHYEYNNKDEDNSLNDKTFYVEDSGLINADKTS